MVLATVSFAYKKNDSEEIYQDNKDGILLSESCDLKLFSEDILFPSYFKFSASTDIDCAYSSRKAGYVDTIVVGKVDDLTDFTAPEEKYILNKIYSSGGWLIYMYSLKQELKKEIGYDIMLFVLQKEEAYILFHQQYLLNWFVNE